MSPNPRSEVKEGQASALASTSIPDLLDAVIVKNDPTTFGFPPMDVPRLADSSKPFRVAMSKCPCIDNNDVDAVLPQTNTGVNAVATLEVICLRDIFSESYGFMQGLRMQQVSICKLNVRTEYPVIV